MTRDELIAYLQSEGVALAPEVTSPAPASATASDSRRLRFDVTYTADATGLDAAQAAEWWASVERAEMQPVGASALSSCLHGTLVILDCQPTSREVGQGGPAIRRFRLVDPGDGSRWPCPYDDRVQQAEWTLRHGNPERVDLIVAASVMEAYAYLIDTTEAKRRLIVAGLKKEKGHRATFEESASVFPQEAFPVAQAASSQDVPVLPAMTFTSTIDERITLARVGDALVLRGEETSKTLRMGPETILGTALLAAREREVALEETNRELADALEAANQILDSCCGLNPREESDIAKAQEIMHSALRKVGRW